VRTEREQRERAAAAAGRDASAMRESRCGRGKKRCERGCKVRELGQLGPLNGAFCSFSLPLLLWISYFFFSFKYLCMY
jgi:hypothetical protein